jgi:hypothetical protein
MDFSHTTGGRYTSGSTVLWTKYTLPRTRCAHRCYVIVCIRPSPLGHISSTALSTTLPSSHDHHRPHPCIVRGRPGGARVRRAGPREAHTQGSTLMPHITHVNTHPSALVHTLVRMLNAHTGVVLFATQAGPAPTPVPYILAAGGVHITHPPATPPPFYAHTQRLKLETFRSEVRNIQDNDNVEVCAKHHSRKHPEHSNHVPPRCLRV